MPYFSIILPIYNVEPYLEDCIQSVLSQTFCDYELILVDDGATDGCPAICDHYGEKYDHIKVIHKANGGLSSARNAGTEMATGTYVWWVDSDDWIAPEALGLLYKATCDSRPDIVKFDFNRVDDQVKRFRCCVKPGIYSTRQAIDGVLELAFFKPGKFSLSAWGCIYRTEYLRKNRLDFVSERIIGSEDYLFNLRALACVESIHVLSEPLYSYRQRAGSLTQRYRPNLPERYTQLYRMLREAYGHMEMLEAYDGKICRFYVWHLLHGTCFANEYRLIRDGDKATARKRVTGFLGTPELRYAVRHCDTGGLTGKQKLQLLAMGMKLEPLFYWLFVIKK